MMEVTICTFCHNPRIASTSDTTGCCPAEIAIPQLFGPLFYLF